MPTGYTAYLDDNPEMSTGEWITRYLTRGLMMLITLRDSPTGMTTDEILHELRKAEIDYPGRSAESMMKYKAEMEYFENLSPTDAVQIIADRNEETRVNNVRRIFEASALASLHRRAWDDLHRILTDPDVREFTRNAVEMGIEQLERVKHETKPYIEKYIHDTPEVWIELEFDKAEQMHKVYVKQHELDKKNAADRIDAYQQVLDDVQKVLG